MNTLPDSASSSAGYPAYDLQGPATAPGLHFALLTQAERASFQAGLQTRLWKRLFDAVSAPTAGEYTRLRSTHIQAYHYLLEVIRLETEHATEPVTDEDVMAALAQVERDLGESWRHKLEHAINVSQAALRIMARVNERASGAAVEPGRASLLLTSWLGHWMMLNWATDCVVAIVNKGISVQPEVIEAIFRDLRKAADSVYATACEAHDARFGDPDEEEE